MAFGIDDAVAAVAGIGGKLIDRLWPDPAQAAAAKLELLKMQQTGELAQLAADTDLMKSQAAINAAEASSGSLFVAGGRPFLIWVCGSAFASQYVIGPLASWIAALTGHPIVYPQLDMNTMMPVLLGVLGLSGMRTYEKVTGTATKEPGH